MVVMPRLRCGSWISSFIFWRRLASSFERGSSAAACRAQSRAPSQGDAKLMHRARERLMKLAKRHGIALRQS